MAVSCVACSDGSTALTGPPGSPAGPDPVPPTVDLSAAWGVSTPSAEGFDTPALDLAFAGASTAVPNLRALIVVRNGRLVREQYFGEAHADTALDLPSVTKTVTALLVGIASDRGLLDRADALVDWIQHPSLRPEHDLIQIRHLMTMTSGMQWSDAADFNPWVLSERPVGYVLDQPVVAGPGQQFMYNTGGSHLLSVIVGNAAGMNTLDFAEQHLFGPLGIVNRRWPFMPDGVPVGGAALALLPRDVTKIGQLLLQGGRSASRQIVSEAWVEAQIGRQVSLGDIGVVLVDAGYGYQTWSDRSGGGDGISAFVMWGYGGQFVWVVPDRQLVVVAATHWRGVDDRQSQQASQVADRVVKQVVAAARPLPR